MHTMKKPYIFKIRVLDEKKFNENIVQLKLEKKIKQREKNGSGHRLAYILFCC